MSTYTELKGLKVKFLDSDPSPATAGDVWYNSVSGALKGFVGRAAWSAGSNMTLAKAYRHGAGTQTAALAAGGSPAVPGDGSESRNLTLSPFNSV